MADLGHAQVDWEVEAAYEAGRLDGLAEYDAEVVDALARALGGPDCTDRKVAVRRHHRASDQQTRRDAFDRGDLEILAEAARDAERTAVQMCARDQVTIRAAKNISPVGGGELGTAEYAAGWRRIHPSLPSAVWLRIWDELGSATRQRLHDLDPARSRSPRRTAPVESGLGAGKSKLLTGAIR